MVFVVPQLSLLLSKTMLTFRRETAGQYLPLQNSRANMLSANMPVMALTM